MSAILHQALLSSYVLNQGSGNNPLFSNVKLLLKMNGLNGSPTFVDSSASPKTITRSGQAQISTARFVFDGASGLFDGDGDRIITNISNDFAFGLNDFCVEFWVFFDYSNQQRGIFGLNSGSPALGMLRNSSNQILFVVGSSNMPLSHPVSSLSWHHVAVSRQNNVFRLFVNGQQESTLTGSFNFSAGRSMFFAGDASIGGSAIWHLGNLDEARVTVGEAVYVSNFTPPSAPFPTS